MVDNHNQSIVLISEAFDPLKITKQFLIDQKIISESESNILSLFSDKVTQVITKDFTLLVLPQQLQYSVINQDFDSQSIENVLKILTVFTDNKYIGLGVNYLHNLHTYGPLEVEKAKTLFSQPNNSIYQYFSTPDSRFGTYVSRDYKESRLKLNITPSKIEVTQDDQIIQEKTETLLFSYNFHFDLADKEFGDIKNYIKTSSDYFNFAKEISQSF